MLNPSFPPPNLRTFIWQQGFAIGNIQINQLIENFMLQMEQGKNKKSSLAMLPSFLNLPEDFSNKQTVIVMDAGGSNLRCALAHFSQQTNVNSFILEQEKFLSMPGASKAVTKTQFFELLYQSIENLLPFSDTIGLCFSYPCEISRKLDGKLIRWTKEVEAEGVEGLWVAEELNKEILKHQGQAKKIVLLNDTVACLLAGTLSKIHLAPKHHHIGFILGTGTNCAYSEIDGSIINIESGAYDGIPATHADELLDQACHDIGHYLFEKKISGRYLGSLCLKLLKLAASEKLFTENTCKQIRNFTQKSSNFLATESLNLLLENKLEAFQCEEIDYPAIHFLIKSVIDRAALLSAIQLAAISQYQFKNEPKNENEKICIICVEGSTFYQLENYQESIQNYLARISSKHRIQYEFVHVNNASLTGAALAALQS